MFNKIFSWFNSPAKVYFACKMTGLFCDEMRAKAEHDTSVLKAHGIIVHHPILKEGIPKEHVMLKDRTEKEMTHLWADDKKAIKRANVFIDSAADVYSTGAKREFGKARYRDWSPVITLWKISTTPPFIARQEDDLCANSIEEVASTIQKLWGTRFKRMTWKLPIYLENWHDLSFYKIWRFFK